MTMYLGNTGDRINWDSVIQSCLAHGDPDINTVLSVVDRSESTFEKDQKLLKSYRDVIGRWRRAGYNLADISWHDYYPGNHFPLEVQNIFAEIIGAQPLRVFISEVLPGKIVPYHWDVEDKEEQWLEKYGMLYRYVCCIDKPRPASVLVFDKEVLYFNNQGDIFQWDSYKDYHSAANGGEFPQYYFHFLGYK